MQNKDIPYSSLLENIRTCKISSSNFELFKKWFLKIWKSIYLNIHGKQQLS
jgi:hypothetical protein